MGGLNRSLIFLYIYLYYNILRNLLLAKSPKASQMMDYHKYKPSEILEQLVECYFLWEGKVDPPFDVESPPNAFTALVINFGDPYTVSNKKYRSINVPRVFVSGQSSGTYTLHLQGKVAMLGAVLRPTVLHRLFGMDMRKLLDERHPLDQVDPSGAAKLQQGLIADMKNTDRITLIDDYLKDLARKNEGADPEVVEAVKHIFDQKGRGCINDLLPRLAMSRRNFERKFRVMVGLSPKRYSRIRRFGHTCLQIAGHREVNLMDALFEAGYYDQSHFIRDFKYFSGRTPKNYALTNKELTHFVNPIEMVEKRLSTDSTE